MGDDLPGRSVCYAITVEVSVKPITNIDDPRYVKAMSHPLRVRILALLDKRAASPVELSGWLGSSSGDRVPRAHARAPGLIELVAEAASVAPSSITTARGSDRACPTRRGPPLRRSRSRPPSRPRWRRSTPTPRQPARPAGSTTATPTSRARHPPRRPRLRGRFPGLPADPRPARPHRGGRDGADARNPHAGETKDLALVMMLFEAARRGRSPDAAE